MTTALILDFVFVTDIMMLPFKRIPSFLTSQMNLECSPISSENRSTKNRGKCIHPVIKKHEETIDSAVPKQLKAHKNVFHSTLQTCCNFPFSSCKETNRNLLVGLLVRALAFHQCGLGSISALSHMWIEFVGSLLFSERFFPGYSGFPLSSKTNI